MKRRRDVGRGRERACRVGATVGCSEMGALARASPGSSGTWAASPLGLPWPLPVVSKTAGCYPGLGT